MWYNKDTGKEVNVMKDWIEGFQASIDYMEQNLTGELNIEKIAEKAALASFY